MLQVWVDAWQQQCCGDVFSVGDTVRWTLVAHSQPVETGDEVVHATHQEERHDLPDDAPETAGVVRRVRAVFIELVEDPWRRRTMVPVAGSASSRDVTGPITGWEDDDAPPGEGPHLQGYLVELAPFSVR